MIEQSAAGLVLSLLVSFTGWRLRALSRSGAVAAVLVGTATIAGTSWVGGLLLGAFFVSSTLLSRRHAQRSEAAKGGTRDAKQVIANGGVAAAAALSSPWAGVDTAIVLAAASLAAATADTWATEIGSRSGRVPRMLLSRRPTTVGMSGGVTAPGTVASLAGATFIGLVAATGIAVGVGAADAILAGAIVSLAGVGGSLIDSLVGEIAQQRRWCDACERWTESSVHACGTKTIHMAGVKWIDNDVVNLACTTGGLLLALTGLLLLP